MGLNILVQDTSGKRHTRRLNPGRDIAYFWEELARLAFLPFLDGNKATPDLQDYLLYSGVSAEDLNKTIACFVLGMEKANRKDCPTPREAFLESGFFDCPVAARNVVFCRVGMVSMGAWWGGFREVAVDGVLMSEQELIEVGLEFARQTTEAQQAELQRLRDVHNARRPSVTPEEPPQRQASPPVPPGSLPL